jgi:hypothetical protein
MFDREGFKFDLVTQRFMKNRWDTPLGQKVREEVIQGLKHSLEIRAILDDYVLDHPSNIEPYGYPYYPADAIEKKEFWVLTNDDLRGIHLYNEDFSNSPSLERKSLSYSSFYNCKLNGAEIASADLSYARFEKCDLSAAILASTGGFSTRFINCNMSMACLWKSSFIDTHFLGCDLTGAYFEDAFLFDLHVNYLTKFDLNLQAKWSERLLPSGQRPDILRSIRVAYEKAELWHIADRYLYQERVENRKYVLWPLLKQQPKSKLFFQWLKDLSGSFLSGYGIKPVRVIGLGFIVSLIFAACYYVLGTPKAGQDFTKTSLESLYFSFATFATLGYGDITYGADRPFMRLLSTGEAWCGAITIALFVAGLARKLLR